MKNAADSNFIVLFKGSMQNVTSWLSNQDDWSMCIPSFRLFNNITIRTKKYTKTHKFWDTGVFTLSWCWFLKFYLDHDKMETVWREKTTVVTGDHEKNKLRHNEPKPKHLDPELSSSHQHYQKRKALYTHIFWGHVLFR